MPRTILATMILVAVIAAAACAQSPPPFGQDPPLVSNAGNGAAYSSGSSGVAPATFVQPTPIGQVAPGVLPQQPIEAAPLPLTAPQQPVNLSAGDARPQTKLPSAGDGNSQRSGGSGVLAILGSLGLVLGLFLLAAWVLRRGLPKQGRALPKEAVETLGRIPLPCRQQGQLLRVGNKVVLISFSSAGADVLAEITDAAEVDRLSGLCAQHDSHSATKTFRDVVEGFFREKPGARTTTTGRAVAEDVDVA